MKRQSSKHLKDSKKTQTQQHGQTAWKRPKVVLPYGPVHFTVEQIEAAVKAAMKL